MLPLVVHEDQCGFVRGRQLVDAFRTVQDTIQVAERDPTACGLMLFIDQSQAFDRMQYDYVDDVLRAKRFGPSLRRWVQMLHSNATSRLFIHGHGGDSFDVRRSARQGDVVSPLLYVLSLEPFLELLRRRIHGVELQLPALTAATNSEVARVRMVCTAFADDITVALQGSDLAQFRYVEKVYKAGAGGCINWSKTVLMPFGGAYATRSYDEMSATLASVQNDLHNRMTTCRRGEAKRYLGAPCGVALQPQTLAAGLADRVKSALLAGSLR